jgi:ribosomal protein S8
MTDPIADMLARLRNSAGAGQASLTLPYSKLKSDIAQILKKEGYIKDTELVTIDGHQKTRGFRNHNYTARLARLHFGGHQVDIHSSC